MFQMTGVVVLECLSGGIMMGSRSRLSKVVDAARAWHCG